MNNLRAEMMRQSKTREQMAELLNIAISSVNNKMTGRMDFKLQECLTIQREWFPDKSLEYLFGDHHRM